DLIVETKDHLPNIIHALEQLAYSFCGEMGITDRFAFKQLSEATPVDGSNTQWIKHHLYVCQRNSAALKNHITFRDALRNNRDLAAQYGQLKRYLAANTTDMDQYVKQKTAFIISILQSEGIDPATLRSIEKDNLEV
ncbi:MAG TPA: GrpB family protein, partial [Flavisolibacter sp.]|nr:GrpB family protein [Flavisolibacter sp.]